MIISKTFVNSFSKVLELQPPTSGLLFFSVLYRSDLFSEELIHRKIESLYGKLITFNPEFNPLASYYSKEMGSVETLKRFFLVTTSSYPREFLLSTKLLSLDWERQWSDGNKRMVNVDLGLISAENFILATTKNYSHRIFLGQNIFADLTYQYQDTSYQTLPWTYPDFKDQAKIEFLNWCRTFLLMHSKIDSP